MSQEVILGLAVLIGGAIIWYRRNGKIAEPGVTITGDCATAGEPAVQTQSSESVESVAEESNTLSATNSDGSTETIETPVGTEEDEAVSTDSSGTTGVVEVRVETGVEEEEKGITVEAGEPKLVPPPAVELEDVSQPAFFDAAHQPRPLSFKPGEDGQFVLGDSWETPDEWGTWCVGEFATLVIPASFGWKEVAKLKFEGHIFAPENAPFSKQRELKVILNDVATHLYSVAHKATSDVGYSYFTVPVEDVVKASGPDLLIRLEFALSASQKELGLGPDERHLGFKLLTLHPIVD